jgi:hypothetical protein
MKFCSSEHCNSTTIVTPQMDKRVSPKREQIQQQCIQFQTLDGEKKQWNEQKVF